MENPVDHTIDLGFVNYVQHPENRNYVVFRFADPKRAKSFEEKLNTAKIWFEKGEEEKRNKSYKLFGIHATDFKKAEKINYEVEGIHKKPLIPNRFFRWSLILFSTFVMFLAIMGYCSSQKKLKESMKSSIQTIEKK